MFAVEGSKFLDHLNTAFSGLMKPGTESPASPQDQVYPVVLFVAVSRGAHNEPASNGQRMRVRAGI